MVLIAVTAVIKNSPRHVAVTADAIIKPTPIETANAKIISNLLHLLVSQENRIFQNCPDIISQKLLTVLVLGAHIGRPGFGCTHLSRVLSKLENS